MTEEYFWTLKNPTILQYTVRGCHWSAIGFGTLNGKLLFAVDSGSCYEDNCESPMEIIGPEDMELAENHPAEFVELLTEYINNGAKIL